LLARIWTLIKRKKEERKSRKKSNASE